jgi:uncharacterized protein
MIPGDCLFYRPLRKFFRERLALLALLLFALPLNAVATDLPPLETRVNDFAGFLNPSYRSDMENRLRTFQESTGYAICIVLTPADYDRSLTGMVWELFESNQLEQNGSSGTVLVLIAANKPDVAIATSQNLRRKFSRAQVEQKVRQSLTWGAKDHDRGIEYAIQDVLVAIDTWFYVFDPPSGQSTLDFYITRWRGADIVLFPLAPFLGFMTGIILMAFTSAGGLTGAARFFVAGYLGCALAVAAAFLLRQPGGILPALVYYSSIVGFGVSGTVAALRPFWFNDSFEGRKPGEPGPLLFHWG